MSIYPWYHINLALAREEERKLILRQQALLKVESRWDALLDRLFPTPRGKIEALDVERTMMPAEPRHRAPGHINVANVMKELFLDGDYEMKVEKPRPESVPLFGGEPVVSYRLEMKLEAMLAGADLPLAGRLYATLNKETADAGRLGVKSCDAYVHTRWYYSIEPEQVRKHWKVSDWLHPFEGYRVKDYRQKAEDLDGFILDYVHHALQLD